MSYIELHARSAFSFLEGSSLPEDMAGVCARLNIPAMALLDTDRLLARNSERYIKSPRKDAATVCRFARGHGEYG
jgi:DNA polymerase III alpha subunit